MQIELTRTARTHRLSVRDYYRMAEAGILPPDARVELIEGEVLDMTPIGSRHNGCVNRLADALFRAVAQRGVVQVQGPLRLDNHSEPQPDLAVLRPRADFYARAHPVPADVLLIIEVADTTLPFDRDVKLPLYARAGITEVWLVDLEGRRVLRYREPGSDAYARADAPALDALAPAALADMVLDLSGLFGP